MNMEQLYAAMNGDYQEAKTRLMNDVLMTRFLKKFLDYSTEGLENPTSVNGLFEAAHSIKGVAGNLAITGLYNLASELTEATRGKPEGPLDEYLPKTQAVLNEYRRVAELIRENLGA